MSFFLGLSVGSICGFLIASLLITASHNVQGVSAENASEEAIEGLYYGGADVGQPSLGHMAID